MTAKSPQTDADLESIDTKIVEELDFEGADRHLSLRLDRLIFLISVVYS